MLPRTLLAVIFVVGVSVASFAGPSCAIGMFDKAPARNHDFSQLLKKAERGDRRAQFQVGLDFESGIGTDLDYGEAARWYRKAADEGDLAAQNNLGSMYARGLGVTQSNNEALKWYLRVSTEAVPSLFPPALSDVTTDAIIGIVVINPIR